LTCPPSGGVEEVAYIRRVLGTICSLCCWRSVQLVEIFALYVLLFNAIVEIQVEVEVSQSAVVVSGTHLGPATNFSISLKFTLDSCGFVIL
jgi:hypothetical protein